LIKSVAAAAGATPQAASPAAELVIGVLLIAIGTVLGFNVGNISGALLRNGTGFTPRGRKRGEWSGPNPARLVGWSFLAVGLISFAFGLFREFR
jgi:hypothetical protein